MIINIDWASITFFSRCDSQQHKTNMAIDCIKEALGQE
jgi:hypothetical protein